MPPTSAELNRTLVFGIYEYRKVNIPAMSK